MGFPSTRQANSWLSGKKRFFSPRARGIIVIPAQAEISFRSIQTKMPSVTEIHGGRRAIWGLCLLLGVALLGWVVGQWIVAGQTTTLMLSALGVIVAVVSVNILNDWRFGVYLSIGWLLFEDLARKYLGNNMAIFFAKDFLIGVTYVAFLFAVRRRKATSFHFPFLAALLPFFLIGIVQIFNANSPGLLYGIVGAKLYFYYIPLLFVGYALVRSEEDLRRLLVWNLGLAGVISLLGIIQAIVGPDFLNPTNLAPELAQLGRLYRYTPLTGLKILRPDSVFVSDGRFASFLILMWILGLGSTAFLMARMQRGRRYVLLGITMVAGAIVLSGARGTLVWSVVTGLFLASAFLRGGTEWQRAGMRRLFRASRGALVAVGIGLLALYYFYPEAVGARLNFYSETLSPESPAYEAGNRMWNYPASEFLKAFDSGDWLLGHGTGTASLSTAYVGRLTGGPSVITGVESGFGNILLEMGIAGPAFWLIWVVALLVLSWKVVRRLRGTQYYSLGFSIWWFAFLLLLPFTFFSIASYQNYILNAYLWLLVGILYRLPDLVAPTPHSALPAGNAADP